MAMSTYEYFVAAQIAGSDPPLRSAEAMRGGELVGKQVTTCGVTCLL